MKIVTGQGYTPAEAFDNKADYSVVYNATISWQKAGKPLGDQLDIFAENYLENKCKNASGVGCHIVVESPVKDSREKPYKVEDVVTKGSRKWKTFYLPVETATGNPIPFKGEAPTTKAAGVALAKELMSEVKQDISVDVVKRVVEGSPIAATVLYSPSINTKLGSFIFFGNEK